MHLECNKCAVASEIQQAFTRVLENGSKRLIPAREQKMQAANEVAQPKCSL